MAADGTIISTVVNTSSEKTADISCYIADFEVSQIRAEIVTGGFTDHNTFENKEVVKCVEFVDFEKKTDGFVATLPPCSVVKFVIN